jgi:diguanylate cyclase (GGDEF)-like protein
MEIDTINRRSGSIRNRILLFSILVTLVPSIGMGWFWYEITKKVTSEKVEQRLMSSAGIIEREIGLWFKERNYDLRVLSSSFIVTENLTLYLHKSRGNTPAAIEEADAALRKVSTYFGIIIKQFSDYSRLSVLDGEGRVLASSNISGKSQYIAIPGSWKQQVSRNHFFVGDYYYMDDTGSPLILVGVPLLSNTTNENIGFCVLEVRLATLLPLLQSSLPTGNVHMRRCKATLLEKNGRIIFDTDSTGERNQYEVASEEIMKLFDNPRVLQEYHGDDQIPVTGVAFPFKDLPWSILIEENKAEVYAGLKEARNRILLIASLLTVIIGGAATIVAKHIIVPLEALNAAVLKVANGDLDVEVPVRRYDELGIVSGMFNEMVARLRESLTMLEDLATTDPLTGLSNRKQIMANLDLQMEGYCRHGTDFALLMLDLDYFKKINDTYGHQAGDLVLSEMATILRQTLRTLDTAGRYGGEEFMIILDTTDIGQAIQTAERIRHAVDEHIFHWQGQEIRATISIGVAAISIDDTTVEGLIGRVDKALYAAKTEGRNRINVAKNSLSLATLV